MSHTLEETAIRTDATDGQISRVATTVASTKDAGRVKFGGSAIDFGNVASSTKDSGRVRFGGSAINF